MSLQTVLNIVPKPARAMASVVIVCAVVIGTTFGIIEARRVDAAPRLLGIAAGLFVGTVFAIWVLGLGYVYADARRRNMPHIPWTLVAMVVPNLLGFLLYFVLRKPIASPCPQCGQPISPEQRFCPSCGYHVLLQPTAPPPPQPI